MSAHNQPIDFQQFGDELWKIANVFRDDTLKTTEYLEEFSYFLFLKLFDDFERSMEEIDKASGKKHSSYLPEKYRFYNWATAHHPQGLLPFVRKMFDDLATMSTSHEHDVLFRKLFSNHTLRIRFEPTIRELTQRLLSLQIETASYDVMGRAYEFVVQKLGEQKQYGQYFTPRHIVDLMVHLVDPKPGEKIYDPACGTCGFLVRAFEHVIREHIEKEPNAVKREGMMRRLRQEDLHGVEKAPDVFKLGLMNMILHGDGNTNLQEDDSLSSRAQDLHKGKYDVILTNPPFGPTAQSRVATFDYHANLYEALFLQHIMNSLAPGGRAATVMKEGLLFSGNPRALVKIRQKLVEKFNLLGVISLPGGVFWPYTGSKTSVLIFERPKNSKNGAMTKKVWFYRVEADGFELSQVRRPITESDLPDIIAKWPKGDTSDNWYGRGAKPVKPHSWMATIEQIRANDDYSLTASRYCPYQAEAIEYEKPDELIEQVIELEGQIQSGLKDLLSMVRGVQR